MKVFKFGGASVKDAEGVRNVARVLGRFPDDDLVVVVSAMGKTTNALEEIVRAHQEGRPVRELVGALRGAHAATLEAVAPLDHDTANRLSASFAELEKHAERPAAWPYDQDYDHIVSHGELWSTLIVAAHLNQAGLPTQWLDAREVVVTDALHRAARVDWERSAARTGVLHKALQRQKPARLLTQGFIARSIDGKATTLGREGSDFSAAILAWLLDAESVTIWKDVAGMFNADPKRFPDTQLLPHISYREAIELSYFGASVIHPRTLQPLQQKKIPLYVRSFLDPSAPGTTIDTAGEADAAVPSFIVKPRQLLISITPRDLSFVVEENLHHIFGLFARAGVRIDLMQNSALAFSVVTDDVPRAHALIEELRRDYQVRYNQDCELLTVRHFDEPTLQRLLQGRTPLVEQRSRNTARFVLR